MARNTFFRKKVGKLEATFLLLVLLGYIFVSLFPVFWTFQTSFKSNEEVYRRPPIWFPRPTLEYYQAVFKERPFFHYLNNSLVVALAVSGICMFFGSFAAYGFSRLRFRGSSYLFGGILASRLVPPISFVIPFTILFTQLRTMDTRLGLIIANTFFSLPFAIWVMKSFFDSIPQDLIDAARIDGCSKISAFWYVLLPLARPGLISAGILSFLFSWNEFMFALTLTRKQAITLPVGLTDFFQDDLILWNQLAAATIVTVLPAIIFVICFQRGLVRGVLAGALKG
jgi:multiple sugar transport system permease protein